MSVRTERAICLGFHKDISAVFCYYGQLGHAISIKIVSVHRHTLTMKAHVVCSKKPCQRFRKYSIVANQKYESLSFSWNLYGL